MEMADSTPIQVQELWLLDFEKDHVAAVDDLLRDRALLELPLPDSPVRMMPDWLRGWSTDTELIERLDGSFAEWIDRSWREVPEVPSESKRMTSAWLSLFELVANFSFFKQSGRQLLENAHERSEYLGALSNGPSRDPAGRFMLAVSSFQESRDLADYWWAICDMPTGVPYFHAAYVVRAIQGMPPAEDYSGGFREDVGNSIVKIAHGLDRMVEAGQVMEKNAREEFRAVATITMASVPFPDRWAEVFLHSMDGRKPRIEEWYSEVLPALGKTRRRGTSNLDESRREWAERSKRIRQKLSGEEANAAREEADQLVAEQRTAAIDLGETEPLSRTLCSFAAQLKRSDPEQAVLWATEAKRWDPWSEYPWTILQKSLEGAERLEDSMDIGWQAIERFPNSEFAWNALGETLFKMELYPESEEVFRQSTTRFPYRPHGFRGLGDALRHQGRLPEALDTYRSGLSRFVDSTDLAYFHSSIGNTLKAMGRYEDSISSYDEAIELDPMSDHPWRGKAMAEKGKGYLGAAEETLMRGIKAAGKKPYLVESLKAVRAELEKHGPIGPEEPPVQVTRSHHQDLRSFSLSTDSGDSADSALSRARTIRRSRRRELAIPGADSLPGPYSDEDILQVLTENRPWDARVLAESMIGAADRKDAAKAKDLLQNARRFPGALHLSYAESHVRRELSAMNGTADFPQTVNEIVLPLKRLREFDRSLRPIELVETVRAQMQGATGAEASIESNLAKLDRSFDNASETEFEQWWTGQARTLIFGSGDGGTRVEEVQSQLEETGFDLDYLVEDVSNRAVMLA